MIVRRGNADWQKRDDYAQTMYRRAVGDLPEMESSKAEAMLLADAIRDGDTVLDVGCGAGHYLRSLRQHIQRPFHYTGVDVTPLFIETAQRAWQHDTAATFNVEDIFNLSFPDHAFDIVLCNNILQNLPSIAQPMRELLRVARRLVLIRMMIGERSFRIQEVHSADNWPFSDIAPDDEFDEEGEPRSFGFQNIYAKGYVEGLIRRIRPDANVTITKDTFYDAEAINRSAATEGLPNATQVMNGMQVFGGAILQPWCFVFIRLPQ